MKTKTTTRQKACGAVISSLAFLGVLFIAPSVYAATVFFDDFEDGNHDGWQTTTTGGIGSTGVQLHNSSQMAFVQHIGSGSHSLSHEFSYADDYMLAFDMQAVAVLSGGGSNVTLHAGSGVTVSFLNLFNVELGSISFVNTTNPESLGPDSFLVDNNQHNYQALMSEYATAAELFTTDPISKINVSYWSWASQHYYSASGFTDRSSATVWFDNVTVSQVPIPAAVWLFGSGLIGLIGIARRKKI